MTGGFSKHCYDTFNNIEEVNVNGNPEYNWQSI